MQKGIVLIEVYKENVASTSGEKVTIYDAGDSFVEHFHNTNEWRYWKILDSSYNNGIYARLVQFVDYDIVPSIISSYTVTYSGQNRGKWTIIRAEPVPLKQLPSPDSWICTKPQSSSVKKLVHERPVKSHRKPDESQVKPQLHHKHPSQQPPSQQYLQQQSLHQQLLLLQQLQLQLESQLTPKLPPLLPLPSPPKPLASLVPVVQPGSHVSSFPLVSSVLLPAR